MEAEHIAHILHSFFPAGLCFVNAAMNKKNIQKLCFPVNKPFKVLFLRAQSSIATEDRPQGRVLGVHICGVQVLVGLAVKKIKETNANEENPQRWQMNASQVTQLL